MNLLCPNCQKMLTVPEEFAGQLMKCPLCSGTFTVPGLPGAATPPPSAPLPPTPQTEQETYSVRNDPVPSPPFTTPFPTQPEPLPSLPSTPPLPQTPLPPGEYTHALTAMLSPKVLPWIAPVCLLLIFVLQMFTWVGIYPGGVPAMTGSAWSAALGSYSKDGDLKQKVPAISDKKFQPGVSVLTIFYLLLFFPALVVTIASVVVLKIPIKLPPQVEKLLPWRWGLVAALNLILILFLALQVLLGFSIESQYTEWVDKEEKRDEKSEPTTEDRKLAEAQRGELLERLRHTVWLRLVVLLHLTALVAAFLMFWTQQRGAHRPLLLLLLW
jgi:hypothetical protein